MLTQLSSLKARLGLAQSDPQYDGLLLNALQALSARFDHECCRTLGRTENFQQEFNASELELCLACYPLEALSRFELKSSEAAGWLEQSGVDYLVRRACLLSLSQPLGHLGQQLRLTYTGGYVLPGTVAGPGQQPLPADLEQATVEQAAYWFQNRDKLGVLRQWPKGGTYEQFAQLDLLPSVRAVLWQHTRWEL